MQRVADMPEGTIRQRTIRDPRGNYGYTLTRMALERRTRRGRSSLRVDIVVWETQEAKAANRTPARGVACKAENVDSQYAV